MPYINTNLLISGADYFTDKDAINALMDSSVSVELDKAKREHSLIEAAFKEAGIKVIKVKPPLNCQDGIYTANWALIRNKKALMSRLPNKRKPEEQYAKGVLTKLGLEILELPPEVKSFSGQGDSIACGDLLFTQSPYRTSLNAHPLIKDLLGFRKVFSLRTKPSRWFKFGPAKLNKLTCWPDSPTYDIDLALALLKPPTDTSKGLIAYCPDVFTRQSRRFLKNLTEVDKIFVSKHEAMSAFALNLVSTGQTVIMSSGAPVFKAALEEEGLKTIELDLTELKKGGGSIRCSSLTLDN